MRVLLLVLLTSCAQMSEVVTLRAVPLEEPRMVLETLGNRLAIAGERMGMTVRAQVTQVQECADVQTQRAEGFRRVERKAEGNSLLLHWIFGGLFTASGAGLVAWTALSPVDPQGPNSAGTNYAYGAVLGGAGLALLASALWSETQLGVHEESLGEKVLRRPGQKRVCAETPVHTGEVRLTLADGLQLTAKIDEQGQALLALPENLEKRLEQEGSRRATLEALDDPRAQIRLDL